VNALAVRLRAELRGRWRGWLGLAIIIGVFGGATIATVAGARRTDTAYPRFLEQAHPFDQFLLGIAGFSSSVPVTQGALRTIPQVETVISAAFYPRADGAELIGSADERLDRTFNAVKVVEGRLPERADEVGVPVAIAEDLHLRAGSRIVIPFLAPDASGEPKPSPMEMTVAGIIATPGEFPPESDLGPPRIHLTPAFVRANQERLLTFPYLLVWLKKGSADLPAFRDALAATFGGRPVIGYAQSALTKNVVRSFHLQAVTLGLFAACLALVTLLVLGQTLGRQALSEGIDYPALRALGFTRRELTTLGLVRAALIAVAGMALAVPIAILMSPLAPRGLARAAEPHPGFAMDLLVLGVGALVGVAVLLAFAAIPAVRAARAAAADVTRTEAIDRSSRAASLALRAGAPPPAVVGVRLALEPGRGRTAVPVRTTILGVALAIAALVVALGFGASLDHLLATPRLYGLTWSADVRWEGEEDTPGAERARAALAAARADRDVEVAEPLGLSIPFFIDGVQADALAIPAGDRTFLPPMLDGVPPRTGTEIVLGPKTLHLIHRSIGDKVGVAPVGVQPTTFTIVGTAVLPTVGHTANLGEGSLVTFEGLRAFDPQGSGGLFADLSEGDIDTFVVRFRPGVAVHAAERRLNTLLEPTGFSVQPGQQPADLLNFGRSRNLPYILSGLLALLALATLAHALFTSITRRRRDFAILKTLGFTRSETRRAVAWQSSSFIVVSLALGILIGVIAGRLLWSRYAESLGILPAPRTPVLLILAIVPVGLLVANALALVPGRAAARTRPALVLRTE
jgi:ABC-type lipoprotein release transport system permease subunit